MNNGRIVTAIFIFMLIAFMLSGSLAFAHNPDDTGSTGFWTPGDPIVPCGASKNDSDTLYDDESLACTRCDLLHLLRHLIDLTLVFIAPVVGTLFFIVAGVMIMMGGDNPGMLSRGKSIFTNTFIGIGIVLMAWLITNTLIQTLAASTITFPDGSVWSTNNWWTFDCSKLP